MRLTERNLNPNSPKTAHGDQKIFNLKLGVQPLQKGDQNMFEPLDITITDAHVHLKSHTGIEQILKVSGQAGISRINIVCVPGTPERSLACNSVALLAKALYPSKFYAFGGLIYNLDEPTTAEALEHQARGLRAMGCDGVKMLEGKPTTRKRIPYRMDDPVYDRFYAFMEKSGFPIIWHVADPETFWDPARIPESAKKNGWDYTDGTFPSKEQLYGEIDHVFEKFPNLKVTFAHFYFLSNDPKRAESFLESRPSVSFDITPGSEMYRNFSKNPELWHNFFEKFGNRIIFGTDNIPLREPRQETHERMRDKIRMMRRFLETDEHFEGFGNAANRYVTGIGLGKEILEQIYCRNFERFAGKSPEPVNTDMAMEHCRRIKNFALSASGQDELLEEIRGIEERLG